VRRNRDASHALADLIASIDEFLRHRLL